MMNPKQKETTSFRDDPESLRIQYKYRRLIREGKVIIRGADARKLIGPDCAYHLYGTAGGRGGEKSDFTDA